MSIPLKYAGWEPTSEGTSIFFRNDEGANGVHLNMIDVRELREDMQEADLLSKGYEKSDIPFEDLQPGDKLELMGNLYTVKELLSHGQDWTAQLEYNAYFDGQYIEVTCAPDLQITAWVSIE